MKTKDYFKKMAEVTKRLNDELEKEGLALQTQCLDVSATISEDGKELLPYDKDGFSVRIVVNPSYQKQLEAHREAAIAAQAHALNKKES